MTVMTAENVLSHLSHPLGLDSETRADFMGQPTGQERDKAL